MALRQGDANAFHLRAQEMSTDLAELVEPLMGASAALTLSVTKLDARLEEHAKDIPEVALFKQVPGVGTISALGFYCVVGDPHRFSRTRDIGAYLGLVPKRDQSGAQDRKLGITKTGNGFLRRLLMQCAQHILGPFGKPSALRAWGQAYVETHGERSKKRARVAVARRLAVILLSMWKKQRSWQPFPGQAERRCGSGPAPSRPQERIRDGTDDRARR